MMKKILALAGSNSSDSINHKLVRYVASRFEGQEVKLLPMTDYDIPIYGINLEKERGIPVDIKILRNIIDEHDAFIISVNEHNHSISSFFKNIIDWLSRLDRKFLDGKKVLLMSTSESEKGGADALDYMKEILPIFGAELVASFSFGSFSQNFDVEENKITDDVSLLGLHDMISNFEHQLEA